MKRYVLLSILRFIELIICCVIMLGILFLFSKIVSAADFKAVELQELSLDYNHFIYARDPVFIYLPPKDRIAVNFNTNVLRHFYLDGRVHGTSDDSQYHWIGLQVAAGVNLTDYLQVGYLHHSQHTLDGAYPYQKFPVEDSWGVKLIIFSKSPRDGVF